MIVDVYELEMGNNLLVIDLGVIVREIPKSPEEIMDIVTKWAKEISCLRFCKRHYVVRMPNCAPCKLQRIFEDLARSKHKIAELPDDTHYFEEFLEGKYDPSEVHHVFVDVGSPFRYLYLLRIGNVEEGYKQANIVGLPAVLYDKIELSIEFFTVDWVRLKCQLDCPSEEELKIAEKDDSILIRIPSLAKRSFSLWLLDCALSSSSRHRREEGGGVKCL
ncbi:hypothetical protein Arcpr_1700 [Archaeoglobus profundus DSM 5631]|uniref:Uncharacterized protein n=1 Tax=Archaeoglobus profundus (strain DSM 5631 / JCM 9629 / NBRC 100127 / Av18) TaxID=572546 RepID=D2RF52_ARCPA|nr:hypothetical protein Arcpr_1700 [Archaeoglobus profundus DSM 5631]